MTLRRLEYLQWFGFLAGGITWYLLFLAGVGVSMVSCNPAGQRWNVPHDALHISLLAVNVVVLAAAETAAVLVFRATRGAKDEDPPPPARQRFFAIGAMTGNVLFFVILLLSEVASIVDRACGQA